MVETAEAITEGLQPPLFVVKPLVESTRIRPKSAEEKALEGHRGKLLRILGEMGIGDRDLWNHRRMIEANVKGDGLRVHRYPYHQDGQEEPQSIDATPEDLKWVLRIRKNTRLKGQGKR